MQQKKAILVVSFGTTVPETRKANIDVLEQEIQAAFPEWEVRRAFTSGMVREKIAAEEGLPVDPPAKALKRLQRDGFDDVIVQPTHIIPGEEYDRLTAALEPFRSDGVFASLKLGRPLLYHGGAEARQPDDYLIAVEALRQQLPTFAPADRGRVVLMGHGSGHVSDSCYDLLQERIEVAGLPVFTATVEGSRTVEAALEWLERENARRVVLMPFMLVAGDHAMNDMAGEEADSWQSRLRSAGYQVESHLRGLGENPAFRTIYLQ
ncbi:MAG TPA: sirohydrochlorin cobaltochelatase, partial [Negativicutes bacterium]|nr:sirohydrochlorin cobaltochelatase [Negativicutes bacterium]